MSRIVNASSPAAEVPSCSPCLVASYKSPFAVVPEIASDSIAVSNFFRQKRRQSSEHGRLKVADTVLLMRERFREKARISHTYHGTPKTKSDDASLPSEQVVPEMSGKSCDSKDRRSLRLQQKGSSLRASRRLVDKEERPKDLLEIINISCQNDVT